LTRRPRTRGRVGLGFVLLGVLLAGLLVGADRAVVHVVEARVGSHLRAELGTPSAPAVEIEHFPFLTQLVRGSLSSVHVVADDVPAPDAQSTDLAHVDLRLHGVTTSDRFRTVAARQVDGTATLDYATLTKVVGHPVRYQPDGRLRLTTDTTMGALGVGATVVGTPVVNVADQTLTLADARVSVAGVEFPAGASAALLGGLLKPVPITGILYNLSVRSLTATPDGLVASVAGTDVTFSR
jgi:hypothetical protein